ncbi:ABC transporter ATP-binding protein [Thermogemmatispora sp.]|uniref:ABC transporter ATP-binding protein n=1 Tax=Thermogemmatispora sp. TaxID=1968838 RepID=UPI001DA15037|nr:ABC transporter ATP-binding protein [Thermogemmatispora sp.]MBX5449327.1 ABC transporter ATP-binding protein [Thermogemmatispora sp.]
MSTLEVQDLVKRYDGRSVVDHVSFRIEDGEFFVLLGPSGSGKTTVLRIICGLERPDQGRVLLGGEDITHLSPRQRNVGMVFQDYGLYPSMDVYGNIAYGLENRRLPKDEIQRRVLEAAEKLQITPLLRRSIDTLSGGEQQRVALARILARDANVFLYDEPLANLDARLRHQARRDVLAVHRLRGVPSLYVTHDQSEALALADRLAIMAEGRLQQVGSPNELLERPANLFVARFLGNPPMNLLEGQIVHEEGGYACALGKLRLPLDAAWQQVLNARQEPAIIVGLRPREIVPPWELEQTGTPDQLCRCSARALLVEALIGEIEVTLELETAQEPAPRLVAVWPEPEELRDLPEEGSRLQIGIDTRHLTLFDPHSERALQVE